MFRKKMIFLVVLIQILSIVMIIFSYGIITNYEYDSKSDEESKKKININVKADELGDNSIMMKEITQKIPELLKEYESILVRVGVTGTVKIDNEISIDELKKYEDSRGVDPDFHGEIPLVSHFEIKKGLFDLDSRYYEGFSTKLHGEYFTKEDYNNTTYKCIAGETLFDLCRNDFRVDGKEYRISGWADSLLSTMEVEMPVASIPENAELRNVFIHFSRMIADKEYKDIVNKFNSVIGKDNIDWQDYCSIDIDEKTTRTSILYIGIILTFLSGITIVMIYRYQLETIKNKIAILLVCGYTKTKVAIIALRKMMLASIFSSVVSVLLFDYVILPRTKNTYTWFKIIYDGYTEEWISLVVLLLLFVFFIIELMMFFVKTPYTLITKKG